MRQKVQGADVEAARSGHWARSSPGLAGSLDYLDVDLKQSVRGCLREHEQALHNALECGYQECEKEGKGTQQVLRYFPKGGAQQLSCPFSNAALLQFLRRRGGDCIR